MKPFKKKKLFWLLPLLIVFLINFSGCLQMRDSDRKITEKLNKKNLVPHFHNYKNGTHTIHYWDILNADKPLLFFVHGSPGSSTALMGIATDSTLVHNFTSVLVDRPGFGYSDFGKAEKSLARQAELLAQVLKQYPNQKKILVGHSLGGPIIAKMAMDFPNEVDAIVILAGSIDPALEPYEWHRKPMSRKWIRWMIPEAFNASNDEILATKSELEKMLPDWEKIKIPITVIQGTKDGFVPKGNADFAKKMAKNALVKIRLLEGASHFFPFTKPEIVVEELMLLK
jgi:pimeloyl-ACP methyl ester carboxylesterase